MNFEEESPAQSPKAGKSASPQAKKKSASPKAGRAGRSFKGSPGAAKGNYVVNPSTGFAIQIRKRDAKTGEMKYNPLYAKLVESMGQDRVNALQRYATEEEAKEAAKEMRAENKASGAKASGAAKQTLYYFNKTTKRVATKPKAGESHPEGFKTQEEAKNWGWENGYLAKKPVQKPRGKLADQEGAANIRYTLREVMVNGRKTNVFTQWINRKGEPTKEHLAYLAGAEAAGGKAPQPKLYTVAQREKMSADKSSSARAASGRASTKTVAQLREAEREALSRGAKRDTVDKIIESDRTVGQKWSALNLLNRARDVGGTFARKGANVNGSFVAAKGARKNRVWRSNGEVTDAGKEFARWALKEMGKAVPAVGDMSDAEVIRILKQAAGAHIISLTEE